jgi:hypothetical protein
MIRRGKQRASTEKVASEELSDGEVVDEVEVDEERPAKKGKKGGTTSATTAKGSKSHNYVRSSLLWLMALYFHLAYAIFSSSSGLRSPLRLQVTSEQGELPFPIFPFLS